MAEPSVLHSCADRECLTCAKMFLPQYRAQRYCSRHCYARRNWTPEEMSCPQCGTVFLQKWPQHRYCSQTCFSRHFVLPTEENICVVCSTPFRQRRYTQVCCSAKCQMRLKRTGPLPEGRCMQCETPFLKVYRSTIFCSDACREMPRSDWAPVRMARELARQRREREREKIRKKGLPLFRRRAISLNGNYGVRLTAADIESIMLAQEWHCVLCNLHLQGNAWEVDHIISVKSGGLTSLDNLQILCSKCNKGKWTMSAQDYVAHCIAVADFARMQTRRRQRGHSESQLAFLHAAVV